MAESKLTIKVETEGTAEAKAELDSTTAAVERLKQAQTGAGVVAPGGEAAAAAEAQAAATEKVTAALVGEQAALEQVAAAEAAVVQEAAAAATAQTEGATAAAAAAAEVATAQAAVAETAATAAAAQAEGAASVTAALEGQAVAAAKVETILEMKARVAAAAAKVELDAGARLAETHLAATFAMQKLAETTTVGGKRMAVALAEATAAVAQFEIAVAKAQAVNSTLVSPATQALLLQYDQTIANLSATTAKGVTQQQAFRAEANLMQGSVGGAARALAGLGGELASVLLPLGALLVSFDLVPRVIEGIDSKTKAWAASLMDLVNGLHEEDLAIRKSGESQEAYESRIQKILDLKDKYVRATMAMGARLIQEEADVGKAVVAWEAYKFAQGAAIQQLPELEKAAKAMGLSFRATHEEMVRDAQVFFSLYAGLLKTGGTEAANAWAESNKAVLDKIVSAYQRAGAEIPDNLKPIITALGLVTTAEKDWAQSKELHEKILEEVNVTKVLEAEIQRLAAAMESEEAAAKALAPLIEGRISALEKLKTTNATDEALRKEAIASLTALAAKYGLLEGAMLKVTSAADKALASWKDQQLRLAELNREYAEHVRAVTETAEKNSAALSREADAVRAALTKEMSDLRTAHEAGLIENSAFNEKMNTLAALLNAAMNAAAAERERITAKERDDLDALAEKHRETAGKIEEQQKAISDAAAKAAEGVRGSSEQISTDIDAMSGKAKDPLSQMQEEIRLTGSSFTDAATRAADAGKTVPLAWDTTIPALKNVSIAADLLKDGLDATAEGAKKVPGPIDAIGTAIDGVIGKLGALGRKAEEVFGGL